MKRIRLAVVAWLVMEKHSVKLKRDASQQLVAGPSKAAKFVTITINDSDDEDNAAVLGAAMGMQENSTDNLQKVDGLSDLEAMASQSSDMSPASRREAVIKQAVKLNEMSVSGVVGEDDLLEIYRGQRDVLKQYADGMLGNARRASIGDPQWSNRQPPVMLAKSASVDTLAVESAVTGPEEFVPLRLVDLLPKVDSPPVIAISLVMPAGYAHCVVYGNIHGIWRRKMDFLQQTLFMPFSGRPDNLMVLMCETGQNKEWRNGEDDNNHYMQVQGWSFEKLLLPPYADVMQADLRGLGAYSAGPYRRVVETEARLLEECPGGQFMLLDVLIRSIPHLVILVYFPPGKWNHFVRGLSLLRDVVRDVAWENHRGRIYGDLNFSPVHSRSAFSQEKSDAFMDVVKFCQMVDLNTGPTYLGEGVNQLDHGLVGANVSHLFSTHRLPVMTYQTASGESNLSDHELFVMFEKVGMSRDENASRDVMQTYLESIWPHIFQCDYSTLHFSTLNRHRQTHRLYQIPCGDGCAGMGSKGRPITFANRNGWVRHHKAKHDRTVTCNNCGCCLTVAKQPTTPLMLVFVPLNSAVCGSGHFFVMVKLLL